MYKKYIFSIFLMVFIVTLVSAALMLAILRQEVSNQYQTLQTIVSTEADFIGHMIKSKCSTPQQNLPCIIDLLSKNNKNFTFADTGDTLICKESSDGFKFIYSARNGDISSAPQSSMNNSFENDFSRAVLFGESPIRIGSDFNDKITLSTSVPLPNTNLIIIAKIDLNELMEPFYKIVIKCLIVEFILLTLGTIFIVMIYTRSLITKVRETSKELGISKQQIRELKEIEKSLEYMKKDMEDALDVGLFGFWHYDLKDHTSNRSLMHDYIFGYDAVVMEWTYQTFLNHIIDEDKDIVKKSFDAACNSNAEIDIACRINKKGGGIRWIWIRGKNRNETSLIGIIRDITSRKTIEKELADIREHLEEMVKQRTSELQDERDKLQKALDNIKILKSILPVCSGCGMIKDDKGNWNQIETYIQKHTDTKFSHGICPDCAKRFYPNLEL